MINNGILAADMIVELIKYKIDRAKSLEEAKRIIDEIYSLIKEQKLEEIKRQLLLIE
ncbi:MAG: hypothetical protein J7K23_00960 [Thermoproteales archaeon]|nr:hypothetical protein [Thermoproteales archaeon]